MIIRFIKIHFVCFPCKNGWITCFLSISLLVVCYFYLSNCLSWHCRRCYIRFIRKVNEKKGVEGQEETRKAFDFMLNYVGKSFPLFLLSYILVGHWICCCCFYFPLNRESVWKLFDAEINVKENSNLIELVDVMLVKIQAVVTWELHVLNFTSHR